MILKNNKIFPDSERNENLKTVEVEYFVRTNRTSSGTVEMWILRRVISLHKGLKGAKISQPIAIGTG